MSQNSSNSDEGNALLGNRNQGVLKRPTRCQICCLMCSCRNRKGFWHTTLGKFIFWFIPVILLIGVAIAVFDGLGMATMLVVYNGYDLETGCEKNVTDCKVKTMCNLSDYEAAIIGCAAVGAVTFVIVVITLLVIGVFIGCTFYCFDSCCGEIGNSYDHSRFTLQRRDRPNRDERRDSINHSYETV